jgi:hypothetical protein
MYFKLSLLMTSLVLVSACAAQMQPRQPRFHPAMYGTMHDTHTGLSPAWIIALPNAPSGAPSPAWAVALEK